MIRIIKNQNPKPSICCAVICCIDPVSALPLEERFIILSCGYIRECTEQNDIVPYEVIYLCIEYVGSIDYKKLESKGERLYQERINMIEPWSNVCRSCIDDYCICTTSQSCVSLFEKCLTNEYCCCGYGVHLGFATMVLFTVLFFIVVFGKDIAGFVVYNKYDCNMYDVQHISFDVNAWIVVGCMSNFIVWIFCIAWYLFCFIEGGENIDNLYSCIILPGPICMGFGWCFNIAWAIIGFLFYNQMSNKTTQDVCKDIVLGWSTSQIVENVTVLIMIGFVLSIPKKMTYAIRNAPYSCDSRQVLGFVAVLLLPVAVFGKDIANLIMYSSYDCDIPGGSDYVLFSVNEWLLCGAVVHMGSITIALCLFYVVDKEICNACAFLICGCFEIAWVVIGYIFYVEMLNNDAMHGTCTDVVISWSIMQSIEALCIICPISCVLCYEYICW